MGELLLYVRSPSVAERIYQTWRMSKPADDGEFDLAATMAAIAEMAFAVAGELVLAVVEALPQESAN
jgi:hypothetical protein